MKVTPVSHAIVALGANKYRQTIVNEIEVEKDDYIAPAPNPPTQSPPSQPPTTTPPPPSQPPATGQISAPPNNHPNKNVSAVIDFIDPKDIPAPIPFNGPIPAGMRGVEPLAGKWRKIPLCGNPPWLYEQTPYVVDGKIERVLGQLGDDIALNAMPALTGIGLDGKPRAKYPLRGGARGVGIATPYTAWHGHTPVRKDGTVNESVQVPLYLGLVASGEMMSIHKDGSMEILFKVPLPNGGFYNDYTLFEPRESNLFYAVNAPLAQIVEINRATNPVSVRTVFDGKARGCKRFTSIRQVGRWLYVCDPDDGKVYRYDPVNLIMDTVADVPKVFWIDYFSNGDLCVMTLNRTVHRLSSADLNQKNSFTYSGQGSPIVEIQPLDVVYAHPLKASVRGLYAGKVAAIESRPFNEKDASGLPVVVNRDVHIFEFFNPAGASIGKTEAVFSLSQRATFTGAGLSVRIAKGGVPPNLGAVFTFNIQISGDYLGKPGPGQSWVNCSVDRNGTCGERDSILALSTHGAANVDTYRITSEGINARGFGQGGGRSTVGRLSGVGEALGHYPWNAEYHPHYGLILVQGFAECVPGFLCPEAEGQTYWAAEDPQTEGVRADGVLMERGLLLGTGRDLLLKEFSQIMTPRGGGLVTADHIAAMSYADAMAFLRAGMITRRPRTFTNGQCLAMLYAMYRQSQRFMREGRTLVDGLISYVNGLPG